MDMKTSPLSNLADPGLLKTDGLVNGEWTAGQSGGRFAVVDPAIEVIQCRAGIIQRPAAAFDEPTRSGKTLTKD